MPNLKWSLRRQPYRIEEGGWARETTVRVADLHGHGRGEYAPQAGAGRELHWHEKAEWPYMLKGKARITAVNWLAHTPRDVLAKNFRTSETNYKSSRRRSSTSSCSEAGRPL
jgi:oxalate decarboxylase